MTSVYVVLIGAEYEGEEIDSVWSTKRRAVARAARINKGGDYVVVRRHVLDKVAEGFLLINRPFPSVWHS